MSKVEPTFFGAEIIQEYSKEVAENRSPQFPVHPLILNRWSPRSYLDKKVSDEVLNTVLEAARWAPSASNEQPWRFYAAKNKKELELFQTFIKPRNQIWTSKAPVLLLLASERVKENGELNGAHAFDAGAAWATLALQARLLGLSSRAVGGFDHEIAREVLQVPENITLHAVIALGYRGGLDTLDPSFHDKELPTSRRPLSESVLAIQVQ